MPPSPTAAPSAHDHDVLTDRPRHDESETLPPDVAVIITIDGPAGTGKSTVARTLAAALGIDFLDTGAMYRAAAAILIDHGLSLDEPGDFVSKVIGADLHFDWTADPPTILAWDAPIDHRIRAEDVTEIVSEIAALGELRRHMVRKQQIIAAQHPRLVSEGRDQGSVVFPNADVKFYLDADPRVRAERRALQFRDQGIDVSGVDLLGRILERDQRDMNRPDGPLVCPDDAVVIDTSELEVDEVIGRMRDEVVARLASVFGAGS